MPALRTALACLPVSDAVASSAQRDRACPGQQRTGTAVLEAPQLAEDRDRRLLQDVLQFRLEKGAQRGLEGGAEPACQQDLAGGMQALPKACERTAVAAREGVEVGLRAGLEWKTGFVRGMFGHRVLVHFHQSGSV